MTSRGVALLVVSLSALLICQDVKAFLLTKNAPSNQQQVNGDSRYDQVLHYHMFGKTHVRNKVARFGSVTTQKPLYDGTNYTFPDTTTPVGIAEVLEVSFVHACMQLRSGYVDILKMFIATSILSYEMGFTLEMIHKELQQCTTQTANRPLMLEEEDLRQTWYTLVYATLSQLEHPTKLLNDSQSMMSDNLQQTYGTILESFVKSHQQGKTLSVEELTSTLDPNLSPLEKAVISQSLRVISLTPVVLQESEDARPSSSSSGGGDGGGPRPPTPPIEGAFG